MMENINIIKQLTFIFLQDYYHKISIINKNKKIDFKSSYTWSFIIIIMASLYLSFKAIDYTQRLGQPELFLKWYLPVICVIIIIELILVIIQIYYYSKDLEYILPLPVKPEHILISKFNTIVVIMYFVEVMFLVIPLLSFGILEVRSLFYFVKMLVVVLLMPVLYTTIFSIIILFLMKLTKIIKNKYIFQLFVIVILLSTVILAFYIRFKFVFNFDSFDEMLQLETIARNIDKINDSFIIINPIINILVMNKIGIVLLNVMKMVLMNGILILLFVFIGKKSYLKNILNSIVIKEKRIKKRKDYKYKKNKATIKYLKYDCKKILENPTFFSQYILQYIMVGTIIIIALNAIIPIIVQNMVDVISTIDIEKTKMEIILIVIGLMQIIFTFSNLSVTAISREGSNAVFMKYIPIDLYKQLKIKVFPQIILNFFIILLVLIIIYLKIPKFNIIYYIITFIISMIINIIHSYIMILIDLKNPKLNWTNEESIFKDNIKKVFQYVTTIIILIFLKLCYEIWKGVKTIKALVFIGLIWLIILIIIKIFTRKNINKLFERIY